MNEPLFRVEPTKTEQSEDGITMITEAKVHVQETSEAILEPSEPTIEPEAYYQRYEPASTTGGLPAVICTCGKSKHNLKIKTLSQWSEKHFFETGHNTKKE